MQPYDPTGPWQRTYAVLGIREMDIAERVRLEQLKREKEKAAQAMPFNTDHSLGRLMYGDPANHSLGVIGWSCKGP